MNNVKEPAAKPKAEKLRMNSIEKKLVTGS